MKDYVATFNTDGVAFPNTQAKNATGAGATDGTEWILDSINDLWGFNQALMDYASLTPSGTSESTTVSQRLEALKKGFGWPGEVVAWCGNDTFAAMGGDGELSNGIKLIELAHQTVLRATYPDLDGATYVGNAANPTASYFYHCNNADGSGRNPAGIYLRLPDFRGSALRGLDLAAAIDPDGASRDIGNFQIDGMQNHFHPVKDGSDTYPYYEAAAPDAAGGGGVATVSAAVSAIQVMATSIATDFTNPPGIYHGPAGKSSVAETRMSNSAVRWMIRY